MKKINFWALLITLMTLPLLFGSCNDSDEPAPVAEQAPEVEITTGVAAETELNFTVATTNATVVKWVCLEEGQPTPEVDQILEMGNPIEANTSVEVKVEELTAETKYTIAVAALNITLKNLKAVEMSTLAEPLPPPTVGVSSVEVGNTYAVVSIESTNAEQVKYVAIESGSREVTAEAVLTNGTAVEANQVTEVTIEGLVGETEYEIYVAAENAEGLTALSEALTITTQKSITTYEVRPDSASATISGSETINYYVIFSDNTNGYSVKLDLYASAELPYLPSGTYTLGGFDAGETSSNYTTFMASGDTAARKFSEGSVTIVATPNEESLEVNYEISGEFTLIEGGDKVNLLYTGKIANISLPSPELPDNALVFEVSESTSQPERWEANGEVPGEYYLKFCDSKWNELILDIRLDPATCNDGKAALPAGTYTVEDGSINNDYSKVSLYNPYFGGSFTEGTLEVSVEGSIYTFDFVGTADSGSETKIIMMNWSGEVKNMVRE
uniref:fibronectin type III domain-containing protein n=1 Tax=Alistipes sp. TaxID=1872444 RepID=UPI004055FFC9